MEWEDFLCYSPLDQSLYNILPNQMKMEKGSTSNANVNAVWTFEENKVFENAMAEQVENLGSAAFFQRLASKLPTKSMQDIKIHFEALIKDVEMIESGSVPIPDYDRHIEKRALTNELILESACKRDKGSPSVEPKSMSTNVAQRRRGVPWTEDEHQLFLMGLNKYGKGDWRSISRYYVMSKTPTQVASHAQKYFRRQTSTTPMDRRRPSIHDIQTVHPSVCPSVNTSPPTFNTSSATSHVQFERMTILTNNSISGMSTNHEQKPSTLVFANQHHSAKEFHRAAILQNNSSMNEFQQGSSTLMNNSFMNGASTGYGQNPTAFMQNLQTRDLMNNTVMNGVGTCHEQDPNILLHANSTDSTSLYHMLYSPTSNKWS